MGRICSVNNDCYITIMTDMVKLRIINSIGCVLFAIYGFVVKAYPVGIINTFIFIVNMYYLYKAYNNK